MKQLNFVVGSICWVPYFIPLVIEGNKRGIPSIFFLRQNRKQYANVLLPEHFALLNKLTAKYNITKLPLSYIHKYPGITFLMEGDIIGTSDLDKSQAGYNNLKFHHLRISFVFNADYIWQYNNYAKYMDYVVLPNKIYRTTYKNKYEKTKNVYLGSPKFDTPLDKSRIYQKYDLNPNEKYLLFFYPKIKWILACEKLMDKTIPRMKYLISLFKKMGYKIIIKSREKDNVVTKYSDHYFEESDLYPINSLELLTISSLAVFFSSAVIEECVMLKTPFIDFKVDDKFDRFKFLHHPSYSCLLENLDIPYNDLVKKVKEITGNHNLEHFDNMIKTNMFPIENISANILDYFEEEATERENEYYKTINTLTKIQRTRELLKKKKNRNVSQILKSINENIDLEN